MSKFVKTLDIMSALKAALLALQLPSAFAAAQDYPAAFTTVAIYGSESLLKALEDLLVQDDRVCFIIPAGDHDTPVREGTNLSVTRISDFVLLIADRNFGRESEALLGSTAPDDTNPGVILLKDLVAENLTGAGLGLPYVMLAPTDGQSLHLTDKEKKEASGRDCWALTFQTHAGRMTATK